MAKERRIKLDLSEKDLRLIYFWRLSCEDLSIEHWHEFCRSCPMKEDCTLLTEKIKKEGQIKNEV